MKSRYTDDTFLDGIVEELIHQDCVRAKNVCLLYVLISLKCVARKMRSLRFCCGLLLKIADIFRTLPFEVLESMILLISRIWVASIFFSSARSKLTSWDITISLFAYEYQVPWLSPEIAAFITTFCEIVMSVLVVAGLLTRASVLPLLGITMVIQLTYTSHTDHLYWAIILTTLFARGAGMFSMDSIILYLSKKI